jgi:hypothetical protein
LLTLIFAYTNLWETAIVLFTILFGVIFTNFFGVFVIFNPGSYRNCKYDLRILANRGNAIPLFQILPKTTGIREVFYLGFPRFVGHNTCYLRDLKRALNPLSLILSTFLNTKSS